MRLRSCCGEVEVEVEVGVGLRLTCSVVDVRLR